MDIITLLQTYSLTNILVVLFVVVPLLVKGVMWIFERIKAHKQGEQENIERGRAQAAADIALEARLRDGSKHMEDLDARSSKMEELLTNQQKEISLLVKSDQLDIKAYINDQYNKYIKLGWIDAETMDILEQRFAIYSQEGGNGFAARMMSELRSLPIVTTPREQ